MHDIFQLWRFTTKNVASFSQNPPEGSSQIQLRTFCMVNHVSTPLLTWDGLVLVERSFSPKPSVLRNENRSFTPDVGNSLREEQCCYFSLDDSHWSFSDVEWICISSISCNSSIPGLPESNAFAGNHNSSEFAQKVAPPCLFRYVFYSFSSSSETRPYEEFVSSAKMFIWVWRICWWS